MPDLSPVRDIFSHLSIAQIATVVVLIIVGLIVIKFLMKGIASLLEKTKLEKTIIRLTVTVIRIILWVLLIFIVAGTMGINMNSVIALFSVLALAVTLAVQGILGNVAGGAQVISAHPFKVGDYVKIGDKSGTVEEIGLVYTLLITPENYRVHIPNSKTVVSEITNYTALGVRRMDIRIGLGYRTSPAEVRKTMLALLGSAKNVLSDPEAPQVLVDDYQNSSIVYILRLWVRAENYWNVYYTLNEAIWDTVRKAGIDIPFPQLDVHLDPGAADGKGSNS